MLVALVSVWEHQTGSALESRQRAHLVRDCSTDLQCSPGGPDLPGGVARVGFVGRVAWRGRIADACGMRRAFGRTWWLAGSLLIAACGGGDDTQPNDTIDANAVDTANEGAADAVEDTSSDGAADTGGEDVTVEDANADGDATTSDTAAVDTSVADGGVPDTTTVDSTTPDTAVADTATTDTFVADTFVADTADAAPSITTCGPTGATTGWVDTISTAGAPSGITGADTAVWIGTGLFVFDGGSYASTHRGAIWDRATHTWKSISVASAPQSLAGFGLAWTGSRVVLWGGRTTAGTVTNVSSGWLYDPVADSWSAMTASSPPAARELPFMQWNGSRVIVYGGSDETVASPSYYRTDGGIWDPVANTWTAIPGVSSSTPLPDRPGTGATWTATGLFVAGRWGAGTAGYFDHWVPSASAWPSACSFPLPTVGNQYGSLVWTGSEAIWWGGLANSGPTAYVDTYYGVGFRAAPGSCTTTSIPTATNAPSPRAKHTAVWTGSRMIVFGGKNASSTFGDGASYDPVSSTWSSLISGTPGARAGHAAWWTGSEMVIWGGGGGTDRAGCIYRP